MIVFYPTGMSFAAAGVAFAFDRPDLAQNHIYVGVFAIAAFWLCTLVAFVSNQFALKVTRAGFLPGTALPGIILVLVFVWWIATGHSIGWEHTTDPAVTAVHDGHDSPRFFPYIAGLSGLAFLAGILLNFAGVESQGVHSTELKDPAKGYPAAIMIAAAVAFAFILAFVPPSQLPIGSPATYIALVAGGAIVFSAVPLIIERMKKPSWIPPDEVKAKALGPSADTSHLKTPATTR
ncbi:amino acid permease [Nocardia sp. 2]|uniref:Amino acid permease n=1 Tax=Nocardia acididurans TaxID=2802282 RepID=A0ABS1MA90_9NOCA|nr:amino acid permease [Nocardia acididurans]